MAGKFESLRATMSPQEKLVAEELRGVTSEGNVRPGLFPVRATGVSTAPLVDAADAFLAGLNGHQYRKVLYPIDSDEWRWWNNTSGNDYRSGLSFVEMNDKQRGLAFDLLRASLSERGFDLARNIMRLNETVAEITGRFDHYGEYCYWLTIFGTPSTDAPWGWQLDGHHCNVSYFVLGDQVVLSPAFLGSEPVLAEMGKHKGTRIMEEEERHGLDLIQALDGASRERAIIGTQLPRELFTVGYRDNYVLANEGVRYADLPSSAQPLLLRLIETWVSNLRPGHAEVKMAAVKEQLGDTHFAWAGGTDDDDIFYYRIHSPVLLVEFDYLPVVAFHDRSAYDRAMPPRDDYTYMPSPDVRRIGDVPYRQHIHAIIRTPNGGDYGHDLLRQHYEQYDHTPAPV